MRISDCGLEERKNRLFNPQSEIRNLKSVRPPATEGGTDLYMYVLIIWRVREQLCGRNH